MRFNGEPHQTSFGVIVGRNFYESWQQWENEFKESLNIGTIDCGDIARELPNHLDDMLDKDQYRGSDCEYGVLGFKCKALDSEIVEKTFENLSGLVNKAESGSRDERCYDQWWDSAVEILKDRYRENQNEYLGYLLNQFRDPSVKKDFLAMNNFIPNEIVSKAAKIIEHECHKPNADVPKCEFWKREVNDNYSVNERKPYFPKYGKITTYPKTKIVK